MNVLEFAIAELDRKAGVDRAPAAMRVALATIAGSTLSASQRLSLICAIEMAWKDAGLTS